MIYAKIVQPEPPSPPRGSSGVGVGGWLGGLSCATNWILKQFKEGYEEGSVRMPL